MKGKQHTKKSIKRMSEIKMGKHYSPRTEFKKGMIPWNRGGQTSEETKKLESEIKKGKHYSPKTEFKKGLIPWIAGKHHTEESKRIMSERRKGKSLSEKTRQKMSRTWRTPKMREYARIRRLNIVIPRKDTSIERKIQDELSSREIGYYKHYPIIGQPDIAFPDKKIAVFADGDYWHNKPKVKKRDKKVNEKLMKENWKVLRYREHEINDNPEGVVDEIEEEIVKK